jgi:hypothetical protein
MATELTENEERIVLNIRLATSTLTLIGCAVIILCILFVLRNLRKSRNNRILLQLFIASFASSIVNCFSYGMGINPENSPVCEYQGFFMLLFQSAENLWVLYVAAVILNHSYRNLD